MKINIYSSGNYIVISDGRTTTIFSKKFSIYQEKETEFVIYDFLNNKYKLLLSNIERGLYVNEQNTAYNITTMIEFLRINTGV